MRQIHEAQYYLLIIARDRNKDGRYTHVLEHECVLCEDRETVMVYLTFGAPGSDPHEAEVSDCVAVWYDLDTPTCEADFDAAGAAAAFRETVDGINSGHCFRVY